MDTITHGIVGALVGKAFFAGNAKPDAPSWRQPPRDTGRVAIVSATLAAMFPDIDVFAGPLAHNSMAMMAWHRNITAGWSAPYFFSYAYPHEAGFARADPRHHENAGADDRPDAKRGKVERTERAAQSAAMRPGVACVMLRPRSYGVSRINWISPA